MKWNDIEKEVRTHGEASKIRVTLLRCPDRPHVVSIVEFDPKSLNKNGRFPAAVKHHLGPLEEAEFFRVEDVSRIVGDWMS